MNRKLRKLAQRINPYAGRTAGSSPGIPPPAGALKEGIDIRLHREFHPSPEVDSAEVHRPHVGTPVILDLKTHCFPFEQRNRRVKTFVPGSGATWKQSNLSWKEAPGTWNDYKSSALFEPLRKLLGAQVDAQHLDSTAKAGCSVFLTSDKTDIWSKRAAIQALANIRVLHMPSELAR